MSNFRYKEGNLVKDIQFKETHQVQSVHVFGGVNWYNVRNISGPGCYQGQEIFQEEELMEVKDEN